MRREHDEHVVVDHERPDDAADDHLGHEEEEAEAPPDLDHESRQLEPQQRWQHVARQLEPQQQWQHVARQLEPRDALHLHAPPIPRQVQPLESRQFRLDSWLGRRPGERSREVTEAEHGRGTLRP
jgi:hypothetical protein